jgi:hypothetical protein
MKPIWLTPGDKSSSADGLKHLELFQVRFLRDPSIALQDRESPKVGQFRKI